MWHSNRRTCLNRKTWCLMMMVFTSKMIVMTVQTLVEWSNEVLNSIQYFFTYIKVGSWMVKETGVPRENPPIFSSRLKNFLPLGSALYWEEFEPRGWIELWSIILHFKTIQPPEPPGQTKEAKCKRKSNI